MEKVLISDEVVRELPDMQAAIRMCISLSGKQMKEVAFEIGIERTHLSKMVNMSEDDPRHFPPNKLEALMDVCGNDLPIRWLQMKRGHPTPRTLEVIQAENTRLRDRIEALAAENERLRRDARQMVNVFKNVDVR